MASRIKEVFLTRPQLRKYFFGNVAIARSDIHFDEVMAIADYYCLYLEQIATQQQEYR